VRIRPLWGSNHALTRSSDLEFGLGIGFSDHPILRSTDHQIPFVSVSSVAGFLTSITKCQRLSSDMCRTSVLRKLSLDFETLRNPILDKRLILVVEQFSCSPSGFPQTRRSCEVQSPRDITAAVTLAHLSAHWQVFLANLNIAVRFAELTSSAAADSFLLLTRPLGSSKDTGKLPDQSLIERRSEMAIDGNSETFTR
jgi:hypothetical protein